MIPPTSIDGTDITGATIDGTDVQEITVDGDVVFTSAVEVNGFLIDDFADNKLTSRDDFATTALSPSSLEPGTSNFTVTDRPEYDRIVDATVNNQQLTLGGSQNTVVTAPIPTISGELTWEVSTTTSSAIDLVAFTQGTSTFEEFNFQAPTDGFSFQQNQGNNSFGTITRYDNGVRNRLATTQSSNHGLILSGTINSNGTLTFDNANLSATTTFDIPVDHFMIISKEGNTMDDIVIK